MDNLMSFGKQAYQAYEQSQQGQNNSQQGYNQNQGNQGYDNQSQGGYNDNNQQGGGGGYGNQQGGQGYGNQGGQQYQQGGPQYNDGPSQGGIDVQAAARHAQQEDSGSSDLFSNAMGFLNRTQQNNDTDVDENAVQDAHQQAYQRGNAGNMDASSMGAAAAMQAMKKFMGSGQSGTNQSGNSGSGGFQSQLIGMAMKEASQLFDQSGGAASGGKQDAINSAGATVMKLLLKNQVSGMMGGGSSGGIGSLLSQFMK